MTNEKDNEQIASNIAGAAYQLYSEHPHADMYPDAFSMYSYNRFAYKIIEGIALEMLESGRTEDDVKDVLQSKHIRWMLDGEGSRLVELGKQLAKDYDLVNTKVNK